MAICNGNGLCFQPDKYHRVLIEQHALPTEDRMDTFKACGLWDQFSTLNIVIRPENFRSFLKGQFQHRTENGFRLSDFSADGQPPPSTPLPSLTNNTEIIEILRHMELIMITVFSRAFDGIFSDFKEAFQGESQTLNFLPSNFLLYAVDRCLKTAFRAIKEDPGTPGFAVQGPEKCAIYIKERINRLITHLSSPAKRIEEIDRYRYNLYLQSASTSQFAASRIPVRTDPPNHLATAAATMPSS
jgi:hypothetical protein